MPWLSSEILRTFGQNCNTWSYLDSKFMTTLRLSRSSATVRIIWYRGLMGTTHLLLIAVFVNWILISVLNLGMESQDKGKSFGVLFLIMWGGAFVVTINTKLLGGHISFFQCVCVLGYCVFPIVLAAVAIYIFKILGIRMLPIKIAVSGVALLWSTFSTRILI